MDCVLCIIFAGFTTLLFLCKVFSSPQISQTSHARYSLPGAWYLLKLIAARIWLARKLTTIVPIFRRDYIRFSEKFFTSGLHATEEEIKFDQPYQLKSVKDEDSLFFYGTDGNGMFLQVSICRRLNRQVQATLLFILSDGTTYQLAVAPDTLISNNDEKDVFSANGVVKFQLHQAMKKWRIVYNGMAKRTYEGKDTEVHLKMNLIWAAFSRPFEAKHEISPHLMATAIAREKWQGIEEWGKILENTANCVDQWGAIYGTYQDNSLNIEREIYLRGLRKREKGQRNSLNLYRKLEIIGACEDGIHFYICGSSDPSRLTHEVWGHLHHPNGFLYKIDSCDLKLYELGEAGSVPNHFSVHFSSGRRSYHAIIHLLPSSYKNFIGRPWQHQSKIYPSHLTLNSLQGRAFFIATSTFDGDCPLGPETSVPYLSAPKRQPSSAETEKLVLLFNEEACRFDSLVGGKGSSLALLTSIGKNEPVNCSVPSGFCVTTNAWNRQIKSSESISHALNTIKDVASGIIQGNLENSCESARKMFSSAPVDSFVQDCIREALQELYGEEKELKRFAVRSSAVGEDGDELSSAGQNATVLGCKGFDAIIKGLQECWASLLSFQSVEYRRQHGQPLVPGMGVVIQEMVNADAAGVLFTVNPNDGDPSKMILTANYGLGESVVSASADPDTFYLKRTSKGELSVAERMIGAKKTRVFLSDDGTREENSEDVSETFCLTDEKVVEIGKLGVYLEKAFGGPRDVEFAVSHGKLFVLQARPITALDAWTDFELRHEFDSPILSDLDYSTRANTGEVLPGSTTPLGLWLVSTSLAMGIQVIMKNQYGKFQELCPWFLGRYNPISYNQVFLSVIDTFQRDVEEEITSNQRAVEMAIFGHIVCTTKMHQIGKQRYGIAGLSMKYMRYKQLALDMFLNQRRLKKGLAKYSNFTVASGSYTDAQKLYDDITAQIPQLIDVSVIHLQVSQASSASQLIAFIILLDGSEDWTPELYGQMAQLLSSISDVESADIPVALKEIGQAISQSDKAKEFPDQTPDLAAAWLQNDAGKCGQLFRSFIKRHGHRGIREFDVATETWGMDPRLIIPVLKTMVANPTPVVASSQQTNSVEDLLSSLKRDKPKVHRALKFIVPRCRSAVVAREKTKSLLIRAVHQFRLAYRKLAHLLLTSGKIPDADLMLYMTHPEIQQVIRSNDSAIIGKAVRRRKIFPELDAVVFPEICSGVPKPISSSTPIDFTTSADGVQLTGTPAFKGTVRATVRVALNLEEAKQIKRGDILITRCTDIGWSPYFPLLSAVVTELGGLISHGAVVAREYGLPAIVGCQNATQVFHSGDIVVLDGTKGTITLVEASGVAEESSK